MKSKYLNVFVMLMAVLMIGGMSGCSIVDEDKDKEITPFPIITKDVNQSSDNNKPSNPTSTPSPTPSPEPTGIVDEKEYPELAEMNPSYDDLIEIYDDYKLTKMKYVTDPDKALQTVADKYKISTKQVEMVYSYVYYNYSKVVSKGKFNPNWVRLKYGKLISINEDEARVVIKAKITPSFSNSSTIEQNYYTVCDLITSQGFDIFNEIQYWAVADMTNGSESKVISFTISKKVIDQIAEEKVLPLYLADYLDDLWILPSLLNVDSLIKLH